MKTRDKILTMKIFMVIFWAAIGCSVSQKEKEKESKYRLFTIASISNESSANSNREMYSGFADIPVSIYKLVGSSRRTSSAQGIRTLATSDYKFVNSTNTSSVASMYDLARATVGTTRDITKSIGDMLKVLDQVIQIMHIFLS